MNTTANKQSARAFFAALDAGDAAALARLLHEDIAWVVPASAVPPYPGRHHGREHIVQLMLGAVQHTFVPGSMATEILLLVAEGEVVVAETALRAQTPAGRCYDNRYVFIFEFAADHRILEIREHVDTACAVAFFGAQD